MESPQLGTSRCHSPPVFVLASLGHMTVNLRRQLPTPSARCLGTPSTPEPPQFWPLRHPLSGHTQHLPSSYQLGVPLGSHSTPQLRSFWLRYPQTDGSTCCCSGAPLTLPVGGGCEGHFLTFSHQKASGGLSSPHPSWALSCPRPDPAWKVAAKDTRSRGDTGGPWDTPDTPHLHKTPLCSGAVGSWVPVGMTGTALAGGRAAGSWHAAYLGSWDTGLIPSAVPQGSALAGAGA